MFKIKKLDIYLLKSFLTFFFMTFFICVLILLMQFAWKQMPDLIGKGVGLNVLAEFFWYAALQTVPMALPLAILLAALMSFGNLGENFELTAMKSAGISLFRIMRGLILFISAIVVAAFFFSNNVQPMAMQKLWTLIFSLRQKSPEFDIPEGQFYNGISGFNIYVKDKDPRKRLLKDLMIYDFSQGFENATVMLADSGKVEFTADNKYLKLSLFSGESFENIRQQGGRYNRENIPYRREEFQLKEMIIDFNTEFNRYDESILKDHNVSKNVVQLSQTIDSVKKIVVARENEQAHEMVSTQFYQIRNPGLDEMLAKDEIEKDSITANLNVDSLFYTLTQSEMQEAIANSVQNARLMKDKIEYNKVMLTDPTMTVRRHQIEWHRKFTLSFACLIFFFIGAPLGAIVRKGGLGFPVVISVVLFVIYYIIDTTGYKMAREGFWPAYQGMWLSSSVLFPLGIFLTWKAVTDASLFRSESYIKLLEKGIHSIRTIGHKVFPKIIKVNNKFTSSNDVI
ncbi:MAG: YjgP/YjgQ family permease [Porphyromonadaceae bacterium]|nr:YjgP/YjgQ family permease [Porphyromonadaceae bacterium]